MIFKSQFDRTELQYFDLENTAINSKSHSDSQLTPKKKSVRNVTEANFCFFYESVSE